MQNSLTATTGQLVTRQPGAALADLDATTVQLEQDLVIVLDTKTDRAVVESLLTALKA